MLVLRPGGPVHLGLPPQAPVHIPHVAGALPQAGELGPDRPPEHIQVRLLQPGEHRGTKHRAGGHVPTQVEGHIRESDKILQDTAVRVLSLWIDPKETVLHMQDHYEAVKKLFKKLREGSLVDITRIPSVDREHSLEDFPWMGTKRLTDNDLATLPVFQCHQAEYETLADGYADAVQMQAVLKAILSYLNIP